MHFQRGLDPKQSLGIGLGPKIKNWMSHNSEYDYEIFWDVWNWSIRRKKNIFSYLLSLHGKNWVNGEKIDFTDPDYLWESVSEGNADAVRALLNIPDIFEEETLNLDLGTSELKGQFIKRGDTERPMRATNFGAYLHLASHSMYENHPNEEVKNLLLEYYKKYKR